MSRCRFDPRAMTLAVVHDPRALKVRDLEELIESRGLRAVVGGERGAIRPPVLFSPELDVAGLPDVDEDDVESHLVRGKVTVFHFRATSGELCSDLELMLLVLMQQEEDVALRRVAGSGAPGVVVYAATAHRYGPYGEDEVEAVETAIRKALGGDGVRF